MVDVRPNPDALLAAVQKQDARPRRGKLKLFFGMAPGVGKTYAMLEAARRGLATEYALLRSFVQHAGKVLTHRQILREVWGPNAVEQTHYLRVYIAHLREKLESEPARPRLIVTEPGVGYRLLEQN
jgi:DNA-binding response OmpR family regulator